MQSIHISHTQALLPRELQSILPQHLQNSIQRLSPPRIEELRLHRDRVATVTCRGISYSLHTVLCEHEINEIFLRMCGGSLYAYEESIRQGFLPLPEGIRVGVCGSAACRDGRIIGVSNITGLMIRIPHALDVAAEPILNCFRTQNAARGILIYAPPGIGKTTLLRAVVRAAASPENGYRCVVVDTRGELSYGLENPELTLDVLSGYPRGIGIEIATRTMGAQLIFCDEIGTREDVQAILYAANCGVPLIATAHAATLEELLTRHSFGLLHKACIFGAYVGISRASDAAFSYHITDADACKEASTRGDFPC